MRDSAASYVRVGQETESAAENGTSLESNNSHSTSATDTDYYSSPRLLSLALLLMSALCVLLLIGLLAMAGASPMAAVTMQPLSNQGRTVSSAASSLGSFELDSFADTPRATDGSCNTTTSTSTSTSTATTAAAAPATATTPATTTTTTAAVDATSDSFSPVVLARLLYMFLCEGPAEAELYRASFPSLTADLALYCWKEPCTAPASSASYAVSRWQAHSPLQPSRYPFTNQSVSRIGSAEQLPASDQRRVVQGRVFVVNQADTELAVVGTTWTTGRNYMLQWALEQQAEQGWQWAYLTFGDGDVHVKCPHFSDRQQRPSAFDSLVRQLAAEDGGAGAASTAGDRLCWLGYDATLLVLSPAVGYINLGRWSGELAADVELQIGFSYDGLLNSFQYAAVSVLLPYCAALDWHSWYNSQLALVHRSVCVYGHTLQLNYVKVDDDVQTHRDYPRGPSVQELYMHMEQYTERWNSVPQSLQPLYRGWLRPPVQPNGANWQLKVQLVPVYPPTSYGGWTDDLLDDGCRTPMNVTSCVRA